jgi:dTDP-glucose 4,6-dehydratase
MTVRKTLLVTGGAGFIGSNFVRYVLERYENYHVVNLDLLTYAGNLDNLRDVESHPNYRFVHGDICDRALVERLFQEESFDYVLNFAAETHVDRSLLDPGCFIQTDIAGTHVLLEASLRHGVGRYLQVSTDEVYGSIEEGSFTEESTLQPNSPYAASKAGGDLMVRAYVQTHGLPALITRSSNNFGPYQYPEKIIPLFVTNALENKPLPLYGDGMNVRDWLCVQDNCAGIDMVLHRGTPGDIYNIGGGNEVPNRDLTRAILEIMGKPQSLIQPVADRKGHDRRYSVDCARLRGLGWAPEGEFRVKLAETIRWYQENEWWWRKLKDGSYEEYYRRQYGEITKPLKP